MPTYLWSKCTALLQSKLRGKYTALLGMWLMLSTAIVGAASINTALISIALVNTTFINTAQAQQAKPVPRLTFSPPLQGSQQESVLPEQEVQQRIEQINNMLRCPTCQAVSVQDSQSAFAKQIKGKVERMVREGQTSDAILDYFVSRYGVWILRAPPKKGIGWLLWGAPIVGVLLIAGILGWWGLRRIKQDDANRVAGNVLPTASSSVLPNMQQNIWDAVNKYDNR